MKLCNLFMSSVLTFLLGINANLSCSRDSIFSSDTIFGEFNQERLAKYFADYNAAFVLTDAKTGRSFRYNPEQCAVQISPCSTFKIFNAMVGLETAVIKNENYSMKWDGTQHAIDSWNHDQTLQTAVTNSTVWYFQRLASAVGRKRMEKFIHKVHYGNEDISGEITKFWLGDTLKISADEQVNFIRRLINDELPFSRRSMAIVRGLIRLNQTTKGTLYGKTGSDMKDGKNTLGWFVGYLVQPGRIYIFATNIQAANGASGPKARDLTEKILSNAGLF